MVERLRAYLGVPSSRVTPSTRVHLTSMRVVSFSSLSCFGPLPVNTTRRAGRAARRHPLRPFFGGGPAHDVGRRPDDVRVLPRRDPVGLCWMVRDDGGDGWCDLGVPRRLHAIDATRLHQRRRWVVSGPNLSRFGPNRDAPRRQHAHDGGLRRQGGQGRPGQGHGGDWLVK